MTKYKFKYEKHKNVYEEFEGYGNTVHEAFKASLCPHKLTKLAGIFKV